MARPTSVFEYLIDERLCAVTFIHDYFQLLIGDQILTIGGPPVVTTAGGLRVRQGESGFRDALCKLIGDRLMAITETPEAVMLVLSSGASIAVLLRHEDLPKSVVEALVGRRQDGTTIVYQVT